MAGTATPFSLSPAGQALGFGGNTLANQQQAGAETDEERKRRLAAIAAAQGRLGVGNDYATAFSAAGSALGFGGKGGG